MRKPISQLRRPSVLLAVAIALTAALLPGQAQCPATDIFHVTLNEANQPGMEISTATLVEILAEGTTPVLDVRFPQEYAISHIPGTINIPPDSTADPTNVMHEVEEIVARFPDTNAPLVLTCNGPFCGKSKRVAKALTIRKQPYTNLMRYQLGMPVWRALGNTVQTDIEGFAYIFDRDETSVLVDARPSQDFRSDTVACAVNVQPGEADAANNDGRLPLLDKGARVVVFADDPKLAKQVASEIAKKAYWSSSYFGGTFRDLQNDPRLHLESSRRCRSGLK